MKYLFGRDNLVRGASLEATNIVPSAAIYRTDTAAKAGGGQVSVTGPYTGQHDTVIDIEVGGDTGASPAISQPVFTGMGNGGIDGIAVDAGVAMQEVTVTLEDLGITTTTARLSFQGTTLRARTSGAGGNAIRLSVDRSALARTPLRFSLQEGLRQGVNEYAGAHWDFAAALLTETGDVPADAPRLMFGDDPQVYRAWKKYQGDRYVYGFSPAPVRDVAMGAQVWAVTGDYALDVTNGATTERYDNLTSLYDALAALRDSSALVRVDGPVVKSLHVGDMGAVDVSVWTQSYVLGVARDGSEAVKHANLVVDAGPDAPTETLTVRCVKAQATGSEQWEVRGDVSGKLPDLTTARPWSAGDYALMVPLPDVPGNDSPTMPLGHFGLRFSPKDPKSRVAVCLDRPVLGAAARNGKMTFVWTIKPPPPCDCRTDVISGGPNFDCLGIVPEGVDNMQSQTYRRLQRLAGAVREMIGTNTPTSPASGVYTDEGDVDMITRTAGTLSDGLRSLEAGKLSWDPWSAEVDYAVDHVTEPTVRNGWRYAVKTPGTSGNTEPVWPTAEGAEISDGSVVWVCVGKLPYAMWDEAFDQWVAEMGSLTGLGGNQSGSGLGPSVTHPWNIAIGSPGLNERAIGFWSVMPEPANGHTYLVVSGPVEDYPSSWPNEQPTWPTNGGTVTDEMGTVWRDQGAYWQPLAAAAVGDKAVKMALDVSARPLILEMECTTAGTTGSTEPDWPMVPNGTVTDGDAVWTAKTPIFATVPTEQGQAPTEQYYARWTSMMDDVRAAAEVAPENFDGAGTEGDGCWRDFDDNAGWWVYQGEEDYLPIQNGHYYHSSVMSVDAKGRAYARSTREFAFGLKVGCPGQLQEGDSVTITINNVDGVMTGQGYQPGDVFAIRINHAAPLPFAGGVTGDDTLTWSVVGSAHGRFPDYKLVTTAPAGYSEDGLAFSIALGGIPFALGDSFRFSVESGQWRWRRDGGAWEPLADIGDGTLPDGLAAVFAGGTAPSWVAGDRWTFRAEAVNGPDALAAPDEARCTWDDATDITIAPSTPGDVTGILIAEHTLPPDAVITLLASDDDFATASLSVTIPWRAGTIWQALDGGHYAAYRLRVSRAGSARWLWLGNPLVLAIRGGNAELGVLTKRWRLPSLGKMLGLGGNVVHTALTQVAVDDLLGALAAACADDAGRFGVAPHDVGADAALVQYADDSLEVNDEFGHQGDAEDRLLSVTLSVEAAA